MQSITSTILGPGKWNVNVDQVFALMLGHLREPRNNPTSWRAFDLDFVIRKVSETLHACFSAIAFSNPPPADPDALMSALATALETEMSPTVAEYLLYVAKKPPVSSPSPSAPGNKAPRVPGNKRNVPPSSVSGGAAKKAALVPPLSTPVGGGKSPCVNQLCYWIDASNPKCPNGASCSFEHKNFSTTLTKASATALVQRVKGSLAPTALSALITQIANTSKLT